MRAGDFWRMTMRQIYRSVAGMCNLVFTAAMIGMAVRFWNESGTIFRILIVLACMLFPVIQPAVVYLRASRQAAAAPKDVVLKFSEKGLLVETGGQREEIRWNQIRVRKQPDMVIVFSNSRHGYMLVNRVLGTQKEEFFAFAEAKVEATMKKAR